MNEQRDDLRRSYSHFSDHRFMTPGAIQVLRNADGGGGGGGSDFQMGGGV